MKSETQYLTEILSYRLQPMICAHCAKHWLGHSFHGDWCPTKKDQPKTKYLEVPNAVQ